MDALDRVTVVYADDDAPYRTSLLHELLEDPRIDVVAVAVDGDAALRAIREHEPDVALIAEETAGLSGLDLAEAVAMSEPRPATRVALLAALPLAVRALARAEAAVGADGVLDRTAARGEIRTRVLALGAGAGTKA
jgi:chemotaxis response regulator CheB